MIIVVLGSDGCLASGFVGAADLLSLARRAIAGGQSRAAPFEVVTASADGRPVVDGHGRRFEVDAALAAVPACAAVIVPGFVPDEQGRAPSLVACGRAAAWIRDSHARGALACGSCSGVFMLGEAGLLDGRRCTTTWWLHDELKQRYPRAAATWGAALVEDRRVVSASGPLSWIDLVLHVTRALCGAEAARTAADFAVVDTTPSTRAVYVPPGHLAASNPLLLEAERIARHAGEGHLSARELARRLATSERTLRRRLAQASGESPRRLIERVRFETARVALDVGARSVKQVAAAAGYADEGSFRRVFRRLSGITPGDYKARAGRRRQGD